MVEETKIRLTGFITMTVGDNQKLNNFIAPEVEALCAVVGLFYDQMIGGVSIRLAEDECYCNFHQEEDEDENAIRVINLAFDSLLTKFNEYFEITEQEEVK